jgi:sugar phosphate isomerase/epimerase
VKARFLKVVRRAVEAASSCNVKVALESFCYRPFVFQGMNDFTQFVSKFSSEKLGVLLDIGHMYQAGISLSEAVNVFKDRLMDIHVHDATIGGDYRKSTHLPIGKGTLDFSTLIDLLQKVRYKGWLTLEIRGSEEEIKNSKAFLEKLLVERSPR